MIVSSRSARAERTRAGDEDAPEHDGDCGYERASQLESHDRARERDEGEGRTRLEDVRDAPVDAVVLGVVRHDVLDEEEGLQDKSE